MTKKLNAKIIKLARKLSKLEGKKSQVRFGDFKEILLKIAEVEADMLSRGKRIDNYPTHIIAEYAVDINERAEKKAWPKEFRRKKK